MNEQQKIAWAKQMAEMYRLQKRVDPSLVPVSDEVIFALNNAFLPVIEEQLSEDIVTQENLTAMYDILNPYFINQEKLDSLKGYYDIEREVEGRGINRMKAKRILTYIYNGGRYQNVIEKFDSSHSPGEMRTFKIANYEI